MHYAPVLGEVRNGGGNKGLHFCSPPFRGRKYKRPTIDPYLHDLAYYQVKTRCPMKDRRLRGFVMRGFDYYPTEVKLHE